MAQGEGPMGFFSIPRELRDRIYEYALSTDSELVPHHVTPPNITLPYSVPHDEPLTAALLKTFKHTLTPGAQIIAHHFTVPYRVFSGKKPTIALLRTNKQIYGEASAVLYSSNTFIMCNPVPDPEWLNVIGQNNVKHLKNLRLITDPFHGVDAISDGRVEAAWSQLTQHLAHDATGLRHLYLFLDAEEEIGTCLFNDGAGQDEDFVEALGTFRGLRSMVIDGYYRGHWPSYLTEKTSIKVKENDRDAESWRSLRLYQQYLKLCGH
ncbi:MAG: hypothetical protein Q9169_007286 [Polycauliona sp. 2 TL-2023]